MEISLVKVLDSIGETVDMWQIKTTDGCIT